MENLRHVGDERERRASLYYPTLTSSPSIAHCIALEFARRHIVVALIILIIGEEKQSSKIAGKLDESSFLG